MNLKIITAVNNEIAYNRAFDMLCNESCDKNKNFIVIVPEKFCMSVERLILNKLNKRAFTNIQVVTLSRMLKKLLPNDNNFLSSEAGNMVTKKIILDHIDELVCFKKTARTSGFASEIYETISELKNSGVSPSDYERLIMGENTSLNIKLKDIFTIYKFYEEFLQDSFIDAADRFVLLSELIKTSELIKNSEIYIAGYSSITKSGSLVIKSLIESSKSTTIACTDLSKQENSYAFESEMLALVKTISAELSIKPIYVNTKTLNGAISDHIAKNLFSYPYSRLKINNEIKIYEAENLKSEIEYVAKNIKRLIIEGARFNEIAVATTSIDRYENIIIDVFKDYDIPYFLDKQDDLSSHPLSDFILLGLQIIKRNYSSEDVIGFIKNYFSGFDVKSSSMFENFIIKYGIEYSRFKEPFNFAKEKDSAFQKEAEEVRQVFINKFSNFERIITTAKKTEDYLLAIEILFKDFNVESAIQNLTKLQTQNEDIKSANASSQILEKMKTITDGMQKFLGDSEISYEEFYSILLSGITSSKISFIPLTIDSVIIGDVSTSKFFDINYLFVIGAEEGEFPKIKDDCGIIVDSEIEIMNDLISKKIEPTIKTINKRERFKVFELLQTPKRRLFISYSVLGFNGEETKLSSTIYDLKKIFLNKDGSELEIFNAEKEQQLLKEMLPSKRYEICSYDFSTKNVATLKLIKAVRDFRSNKDIDKDLYLSVYETIKDDLNSVEKDSLNNINSTVNKFNIESSTDLFFKTKKTSVSELESYFACPFKHYIDYGLKIRERENSKIESIDIGNIMHKIAELFVASISKKNLTKPEAIKLGEDITLKVLQEERLLFASNKYLTKPLKNEAFRMCEALYIQYITSNFKPIYEEAEFGANKKYGAVKLNNTDIVIEGKIDRIDKCKDMLRVIDYKTGTFDLSAKEVYYGKKIQLFTYLNALKNNDYRLVGAFYLPIKNKFEDEKKKVNYLSSYKLQGYFVGSKDVVKNMDTALSIDHPQSDNINMSISISKTNIAESSFKLNTGNKKFLLDEKEISEVSNYVSKLASVAVNEILDGYISPSPVMDGNVITCEYCDYKHVCKFNRETDRVRKMENSVEFSEFIKGKDNEG